jgi:outer membrane lipoprotein-sorting protein
MKKIFLLLITFFTLTITIKVNAQNATEVLNKTAQKLSSCGGIDASFEATTYKGSSVAGSATGKILIKGNKFKMASPQMTVWFDGKNQWTLLAGGSEVNLTEPTNEELQTINPYTFINLYKNGYTSTLRSTNYQGKKCHEILLRSQKKNNSIQEMRVVVDVSNYLPYSIRLKQNGNWIRIRVNKIKVGTKCNDSQFKFNKSSFPNVELIDLR